ncbi:lysostaphin resistance A-like protein [Arenimonas sp.]|uniref:CPBP family intramembrane glutamic endopeptidase n=1 Tax=Arenimonas sp. TaxID=1872635 RepID=UPI0039E3D595
MIRRRPILSFLLLTLAFSAVFYYLMRGGEARGGIMRYYVTGVMWCPALAALIVQRQFGATADALGWRFGEWRWNLGAYLVPVLYGLIAYSIIWLTGLGGFPEPGYLADNAKMVGLPVPPLVANLLMLLVLAGPGVLLSCASALGEELGWRGFLTPRLVQRFGFTGGSLAVGFIWAAWHVPILFWPKYLGTTPMPFAMACFFISLIASSFVYTWFRLRSGSVWPAVLLHASHNVFIPLVFTPLTAETSERTAYAVDEFGFMLAAVNIVLALAFWWRRDEATRAAVA